MNNIKLETRIALFLIKVILLIFITYQDEKDMEFSSFILFGLFISTIVSNYIYKELPYKSLLLATMIQLAIYFISKNNYGLGDVLINIVLSLDFYSPLYYFYFFTLQFIFGAIYSIFFILKGNSLESKIPFTKFILISYILSGVLNWIHTF